MKQILFLAISLVAAVVFAADNGANVKSELAKLQGTWQLTSATKDGQPTPDEVVQKIRVVIKDSTHTVYFDKETIAKEIPFTIDPETDPRATDDKLPDGKIIRGIYKLDGDTLTSCVGAPDKERPKEFAAGAGTGCTLRVFKRIKE